MYHVHACVMDHGQEIRIASSASDLLIGDIEEDFRGAAAVTTIAVVCCWTSRWDLAGCMAFIAVIFFCDEPVKATRSSESKQPVRCDTSNHGYSLAPFDL